MKVYRYRHTQRSQRDTHNATRSCHAGQNCTVEHREPAAATIHIAHRLDLPKHRNSINTNRNNAYVNIGLTNISSVFTNIINNHRCFFVYSQDSNLRLFVSQSTALPLDHPTRQRTLFDAVQRTLTMSKTMEAMNMLSSLRQ